MSHIKKEEHTPPAQYAEHIAEHVKRDVIRAVEHVFYSADDITLHMLSDMFCILCRRCMFFFFDMGHIIIPISKKKNIHRLHNMQNISLSM